MVYFIREKAIATTQSVIIVHPLDGHISNNVVIIIGLLYIMYRIVVRLHSNDKYWNG